MRNWKTLVLLVCLVAFSAALFSQELLEAVKTGDLAKVKALVEKEPGIVNAKNPGGQAILFAAVSLGQLEIVEYLISKGAEVNERSTFGLMPLHIACMRNVPLGIVRLLVEKGADVNAVAKYSGKPLDLALDTENSALIDYLKSKGASSTPLVFETYRLASQVYRVAYPWGMRNNIVVFSGPDGILLVDSGFSKHAVKTLRETIGDLAKGEIKYIIDTHLHGDHVDGNGIGGTETKVINSQGLANPDFKGMISRTDHPLRGGAGQELAGYMSFLDKVIDVFPAGTTFVSGHGKDLDNNGLRKYRDDLAAMIAIIRKNYAAGKSAEDMIRDDLLKAYKAEYSFLDWIGPDSWLQRIVGGLRSGGLK